MTQRVFNFSAGPAAIPLPVLQRSAAALVDFEGKGVGIAEVSHRGPEFNSVREDAEARCRALLDIPEDYAVLFLQGGATQQFDVLAMNYLAGAVGNNGQEAYAEYVDSGQWAAKAAKAAAGYGDARVIASSKEQNYVEIPGFEASDDAAYLHICSNNTIFGTQFQQFPEHHTLIADMSSDIMSRPLDIKQFGMIYAGAQKNLGPSGVVLVIIRKDLLEKSAAAAPIFNYAKHAAAESCLNTPPTFGITVLRETFRWLQEDVGGLAKMQAINEEKAQLLYSAMDNSDGFYQGTVTDTPNRSRMNVTFVLPSEDLTKAFLAGAAERDLVALKGYRTVGGIRASIYNAMPVAGVQALVDWMAEFRQQQA